MQLYHFLPTAQLTEKETLLQAVVRKISDLQQYVVTQTLTQKLDGDQAFWMASDEQLDYETALMVTAAQLVYWEQQPLLH